MYTGNPAIVIINSALAPGIHVVRLTVTGYKQAEATGTYANLTSFFAYGSGVYTLSHRLWHFTDIVDVINYGDAPVWEISHSMKPTGATIREWLGHTGSLKFTIMPVLVVDGVEKPLGIGSQFYGQTLSYAMQYSGHHSEIGGGVTQVCLIDLAYNLHGVTGLTIAHQVAWLMGGDSTGFPGMMTLAKTFDRIRTVGGNVISLTNSGNQLGNTINKLMYAWDADGYVGALLYIPDLAKTVLDWALTTNLQLYMYDTAILTWNKIYAYRADIVPEVFANGTIWNSEINYRIKWFEEGADAALGQ
jgi:hypothetical protein